MTDSGTSSRGTPGMVARHAFNLVHDPWLPVTLLDGSTTSWGLAEFYARAHEARGLNEPSPLTYTAIMRYLLAILHRATNGPIDPLDWAERWHAGLFQRMETDAYLAKWEHRFDLFDPQRPFAQADANVTFKLDETVARLFMERTSGGNALLFDHTNDSNPPALTFGEACRALLTAQAYGFSGAQIFANSTMIAGYSILFEGNNLFETLLLNLQEYSDDQPRGLQRHGDRDKPWWELDLDPPIEREGNVPLGLTDLLTWRSRTIRLIADKDGYVRRCNYVPGYKIKEGLGIHDPFKRYGQAASGPSKGQFFPKNFVPGRALWRDSFALIERQQDDDPEPTDIRPTPVIVSWLADAMHALEDEYGLPRLVPTLIATGLVNNKAKIDLWRMDRLPLPVAVLNEGARRLRVRDAVAVAKDVRDALNRAGTTFAIEALTLGERSPDPNDVTRERASLKLDERYWSRLDAPFQRFMIDLAGAEDIEAPVRQWKDGLRDIARSAFTEATTSAGLDSRWFRAQAIGARTLERLLRKVLSDEATTTREPRVEVKV